MRTTNMTANVTVFEIDFTVSFIYSPPLRGSRDLYGVPLEPDEPEQAEIQTITLEGSTVDLIDIIDRSVFDSIQQAVYNYLDEKEGDY